MVEGPTQAWSLCRFARYLALVDLVGRRPDPTRVHQWLWSEMRLKLLLPKPRSLYWFSLEPRSIGRIGRIGSTRPIGPIGPIRYSNNCLSTVDDTSGANSLALATKPVIFATAKLIPLILRSRETPGISRGYADAMKTGPSSRCLTL